MLRKVTRHLLALAVLATAGLGASAITTPAAAGNLTFGVTIGAPIVQSVDYRRGQHYRPGRAGLCNPQQALRKAGRLGVNRAHLVRANRNAVVVQGRQRGDRVTVRFAQARGCPVLAYR